MMMMTRMMTSQMILRKWRTNKFVLKLDLKTAPLGTICLVHGHEIILETIVLTSLMKPTKKARDFLLDLVDYPIGIDIGISRDVSLMVSTYQINASIYQYPLQESSN